MRDICINTPGEPDVPTLRGEITALSLFGGRRSLSKLILFSLFLTDCRWVKTKSSSAQICLKDLDRLKGVDNVISREPEFEIIIPLDPIVNLWTVGCF